MVTCAHRNLSKSPITRTQSQSSRGTTPGLDEIDEDEEFRREKEAHDALIAEGGRPSHPPNGSGFAILEEPGRYAEIISYWSSLFIGGKSILREQRWYWENFRKYQDSMRMRYGKPSLFKEFAQYVRDYRREKGLQDNICLRSNRKEQSRLDDWKEFQFREYRKADQFTKEIERAEEDLKTSERELQASIVAGHPADRINWIKVQGVAYDKARRGTAQRELKRHAVFLKWIDEQLLMVASECAPLDVPSHFQDHDQSSSVKSQLGKRKRSTEDIIDHTASHRKLSKSCHQMNSGSKSELHSAPSFTVSSVINTSSQDSRLVDSREDSVHGFLPRRSGRIANAWRRGSDPNPAATPHPPGRSSAVHSSQLVQERETRPSDIGRQALNAPCTPSKPPGPRNGQSLCLQEPCGLGRRDVKLERACNNTGLRRSRRILEKREKLFSCA